MEILKNSFKNPINNFGNNSTYPYFEMSVFDIVYRIRKWDIRRISVYFVYIKCIIRFLSMAIKKLSHQSEKRLNGMEMIYDGIALST